MAAGGCLAPVASFGGSWRILARQVRGRMREPRRRGDSDGAPVRRRTGETTPDV